ncbi:hypothetical protein [Trichlorobacter ammonificans]|uniref:Tetratricopeptide repeat protein n=1 Tax=Trichlorobacter ammonificans TaxID=2916410 RepID=A0ABM9D5J1_9BACT|nr:hypothetical protein [Trichlorobacter ammonificans]CAH2030149.1 conserved exported protein of unknown function [Trichlorobacter ammonificans]
MVRTATTVLLALLLAALLVTATVHRRQQAQFAAGEQGSRAGDFMMALTGYESAIRMYLPFSDAMEQASERIWALGLVAERRSDVERALIAYRSLRSAWYGVCWLHQPGQRWIERCDTKIAALAPLRKGASP